MSAPEQNNPLLLRLIAIGAIVWLLLSMTAVSDQVALFGLAAIAAIAGATTLRKGQQ